MSGTRTHQLAHIAHIAHIAHQPLPPRPYKDARKVRTEDFGRPKVSRTTKTRAEKRKCLKTKTDGIYITPCRIHERATALNYAMRQPQKQILPVHCFVRKRCALLPEKKVTDTQIAGGNAHPAGGDAGRESWPERAPPWRRSPAATWSPAGPPLGPAPPRRRRRLSRRPLSWTSQAHRGRLPLRSQPR